MNTYTARIPIIPAVGTVLDVRMMKVSLPMPPDGLARFMGASPEPQVEVFEAGYRQKPSWPRTAQNSGGDV